MKRQFVPVQPSRRRRTEEADLPVEQQEAGSEELIEEIDELLDEIDEVLEEQTVLVNYRQRSGQ